MGTTQTLTRRIAKGTFPEDQQWGFESLFDNNEVGVRYEIWDTSTLFQNAAGTTPVTAPGQPVGLMLDKSKNLALGSQLITPESEAFTQLPAQFTGVGLTTSFTDGRIRGTVTTEGTSRRYDVIIPTVAGRTYLINYVGSNNILTAAVAWVNTNASSIIHPEGDFEQSVRVRASSTSMTLRFYPRSASQTQFAGDFVEFSQFSVRELAGNHASQATDASRPTYGVVPKGGQRNLLLNTDLIAGAASGTPGTVPTGWTYTLSGGTLTVVPDGLRVAATDSRAIAGRNVSFLSNTTYTFSCVCDIHTASQIQQIFGTSTLPAGTTVVRQQDGNTLAASDLVQVANNTTLRVILTFGETAGVQAVRFGGGLVSNATTDVTFKRIQLEIGSTRTNYQRVGTTAFEITEQGVPTTHYLQFDGVDDSLVTSSVDFSAVNIMSVFCGVRKFSDAVFSNFIGYEPLIAKGFQVGASSQTLAPTTANYNLNMQQQASTVGYSRRLTTFTAPISNVLYASFDRTATALEDAMQARVNGSVPTYTNAASLGDNVGTFPNAPLRIGAAGGTFFNGQLYSTIVRAASSSTAEIRQAEKLIAKKTSLVTLP
jgi:hypothetical protein